MKAAKLSNGNRITASLSYFLNWRALGAEIPLYDLDCALAVEIITVGSLAVEAGIRMR